MRDSMAERAVPALLMCGILSSILYFAGEVAVSLSWPAYSYANQAVSELAAIGAPTRTAILALFTAYNALVVACALGVWLVPSACSRPRKPTKNRQAVCAPRGFRRYGNGAVSVGD